MLGLVRRTILKAVPRAEESIAYNIPAYKLDGDPVLYFAAWKQHYSIYPATDTILAKFARPLARFKIVKRTIRFSYSEPVPVKLIASIAKFRAKEIAENS